MDVGRKKFAAVAGALVLAAILAIAVHALHRAPQPVQPFTVGSTEFTIGLPESGVVQYPQIQTMSSEIPGNIGRIDVRAGQRVVAGQLLATIVNPQILSDARSSAAAYRAAAARSQSASVTGGSNVVQAQANLEAARARLAQAQEDLAGGLQSAPGAGETTAANARAQADAALATAATQLREARRVYLAYSGLYAGKAVSRDRLDRAEAAYEQAQVAYRQASVNRSALGITLVRSKQVLQDELRSAQEGFAQAQSALATARVEAGGGDAAAAAAEAQRAGSEYAFAQEQADAARVLAPYDGVVLDVATERTGSLRPLQPGDAIVAGQPLLTLAARHAFVVRTRVDEQDVIDVRLGERATITGEDFPGQTLTGRVVEVASIAEKTDPSSTTRTVATTIAVNRPPQFLRDGMSVDVDIFTTDLHHAIVVPNDAILHQGSAAYVFVIRKGDAYRQAVRLGPSSESESVILAGLRPGDVIVAQNAAGLTNGAAVELL